MNKVLISLFILTLTSCIDKSKKDEPINGNLLKNQSTEEYITTNKDIKQKNEREIADSIKQNFLESHKIKESPIKIISSQLHKNQYSDHKDIELKYKNATKKNIKAIKFEWYCENAFEKPASGQFFFVKGISKGTAEILLKPNKIQSKTWEDFSTDAYKIIAARAYYVIFSDGTEWELK